MSGFAARALSSLIKVFMKLTSHWHLWKFGGLLVADIAVFSATNADNVPSFELMLGFLLLALTFYYLMCSLLTFVRLYGVSIKRKRRLAAALTGMMSGLVALQSIGELNSHDVVVLLPLMLVAYVYSFYIKTNARAAESSV
jgi:hypothetical protein